MNSRPRARTVFIAYFTAYTKFQVHIGSKSWIMKVFISENISPGRHPSRPRSYKWLMKKPWKALSPNFLSGASSIRRLSLWVLHVTVYWLRTFLQGVTIFFWQDKLSIPNGKLIMQPPQCPLLTSQVQVVFITSGNFQRHICRCDRHALFPLLLKPRQISAVIIPGITGFQDLAWGAVESLYVLVRGLTPRVPSWHFPWRFVFQVLMVKEKRG